jgi:hypothetical protein
MDEKILAEIEELCVLEHLKCAPIQMRRGKPSVDHLWGYDSFTSLCGIDRDRMGRGKTGKICRSCYNKFSRDAWGYRIFLYPTKGHTALLQAIRGERISGLVSQECAVEIDKCLEEISRLNPMMTRGVAIVKMRFGVGASYPSKTLEEVAKVFHVTRERARQVESKVLRKLRHRMSRQQKRMGG